MDGKRIRGFVDPFYILQDQPVIHACGRAVALPVHQLQIRKQKIQMRQHSLHLLPARKQACLHRGMNAAGAALPHGLCHKTGLFKRFPAAEGHAAAGVKEKDFILCNLLYQRIRIHIHSVSLPGMVRACFFTRKAEEALFYIAHRDAVLYAERPGRAGGGASAAARTLSGPKADLIPAVLRFRRGTPQAA